MNKKIILIPVCVFIYVFFLSSAVFAQTPPSDLTQVSMQDLMNVQVYSASKKPERFFNTAAAISVITPEDIRRSGATSIPELLRMVPGINVQQVSSHSWDISARGFNGSIFSNKLLVLIDGRAVYTPLYGGVFWDVQDVVLEDIERIEVIRGPGGTLWGANAVDGVINIITKKAKDTQGGLLSAGGGNQDRAFSTLRYGARTGQKDDDTDWFYRAYAKYINDADNFRSNGTANDEWQMARTGFRAEKEKMTFQGDFYQGFLGQRVSETSFNAPFTQVVDRDATVQGGNLMAKYEDDDWSLQSYWDETNRNLQIFEETRNAFDLDFTKHFQATEKQEITWGGGYLLNLEDDRDTTSISIKSPTQTDQVLNTFLQDEINLTDKLKLTVGSKLEHNIYTHFEVEPNVRLAYNLTDKSFVWAAASRSVRTPSRIEENGEITGATVTGGVPVYSMLEGNDNLSAETMRSYEVGYRAQPMENVLVDLSLYVDHYDNLITYTTGNVIMENGYAVALFPAANGMQADVEGFELSSDIKFEEWWKLKTWYTFAKSGISTYPDITDIGVRDFLENSFPRQSAYMRSSFDLPYAFEFDLTLRYTDSFDHGSVPSNTGVDVNLAKTINQWQISLVGQNLLRSHHFESEGTGIGLTQVERSYYVKATYKF
jgi:iron complex outermembrane receptor protein